jgi:hypothetical protein
MSSDVSLISIGPAVVADSDCVDECTPNLVACDKLCPDTLIGAALLICTNGCVSIMIIRINHFTIS